MFWHAPSLWHYFCHQKCDNSQKKKQQIYENETFYVSVKIVQGGWKLKKMQHILADKQQWWFSSVFLCMRLLHKLKTVCSWGPNLHHINGTVT
jgi:hypothetical protein